MRKTALLMLLAACAPSGQAGHPAPEAAGSPALRDLGRSGGLGAWRLRIDLPEPGYILVLAARARIGLEPVALSVASDTPVVAGPHIVSALPEYGAVRAGCATPTLHLQAVFPVESGGIPLATLSEPPLPAASGAVPVLLEEPTPGGCMTPPLPRRSGLYLLVASEPIDARAVRAAIDGVVPGTPDREAARLVADALGALLTPVR